MNKEASYSLEAYSSLALATKMFPPLHNRHNTLGRMTEILDSLRIEEGGRADDGYNSTLTQSKIDNFVFGRREDEDEVWVVDVLRKTHELRSNLVIQDALRLQSLDQDDPLIKYNEFVRVVNHVHTKKAQTQDRTPNQHEFEGSVCDLCFFPCA